MDLEHTITDVIEGKEYLFSVAACNKCGPGEPAYIDEPVNVSSPASEYFVGIQIFRPEKGRGLLLLVYSISNYGDFIFLQIFRGVSLLCSFAPQLYLILQRT